MSSSSRFVACTLGAALVVGIGSGSSAAQERGHAVPRGGGAVAPHGAVAASPSFNAPNADAGQFTSGGADRADWVAGIVDRSRAQQARFAEAPDAGDQARQRSPGGARSGSGGGGSRSGGAVSSGRSGGGSSSGATARPRGGDTYSGGSRRGGDSNAAPTRDGDGNGAAEAYRRGRGTYQGGQPGRTGSGYGYAVPRRGGSYYPRYDYYRSYRPSYYYPYYGNFGLGYYFWDPTWYGWGYGGYYGPYGYGYGGYGYGGYGYGGYGNDYEDTGSVRIRVSPREAQVYVDGYYVGIVDEFDGTFQRLRLDEGPHRIEVRLDGYDTLRFDVRVLLDSTITLRGDLRPIP